MAKSYWIVAVWAVLGGCTLFDKDERIPAFINVDRIEVRPTGELDCTPCAGASTSQISDAWVYVNGELLGGYELPATVPVFAEGPTSVVVGAGIRNSGFSDTRLQYPFYDFYRATIDLIPGEEVDFSQDSTMQPASWKRSHPVVAYYESGLNFWTEAFQQPSSLLTVLANSDTLVEVTNNPAEVLVDDYGDASRSAKIVLTPDRPYFGARLDASFAFEPGRSTYLEVDYKNDCPVEISIIGNNGTASRRVVGFLPRSTWGKIYVDLSEGVRDFFGSTEFQIFIEANNIDNLPVANVYLDNLKVVYN